MSTRAKLVLAVTLDGSAPPTLPDRVRGGGLVETAWVDERHAQRLRPGCGGAAVGGRLTPLEFARWPTLLEPWIAGDMRSAAEQMPWATDCAAPNLSRALRVSGIEAGSVIRPVPGSRAATVRVQAIGSLQSVHWLLDGRLVGTTTPRAAGLRLTLEGAGEHALTAMDTQGRYERVVFSVR